VIETQVQEFVLLLMIAAAVAMLVKRLPVPYVTALALVGAGAGLLPHPAAPALTHSAILFVILPGLLFEAGFNLRWNLLSRDLVAVGVLATFGVLLTTGAVTVLGITVLGLSLPAAIVFGAMVAATDPVAVVALFRRLGIPGRLTTILEAESLLNDGTGVVVFGIALGALTAGGTSLGAALMQFVWLTVGGLALGAGVGLGVSLLTARLDDAQVEITFTAIAAYGGYLAAEAIHVSGILTVVAAAIVLGNYGRTHGMSQRTSTAVDTFWDYVAFLLNSAIFLLIGLSIPLGQVVVNIWLVIGAVAVLLGARAVVVYCTFGALRPFGRHVPLRWQHLLVWGGLRGAIAIALLLSIQASTLSSLGTVPALVYGIVLFNLVAQGITIGPVTSFLLADS
jgi:CPA1 family monovalent cation:H+ antiporter